MSSFSVRFLTPPTCSLPKSKTWLLSAATPSVATVSDPEVEASRLEPRVEERDGYWVLKEEYRGGINPHEKVKLEKDPMKLFMEGGLDELAKLSLEEIETSKHTKDDIDVRLKWLGLFHRRKHHCKFQLLTSSASILYSSFLVNFVHHSQYTKPRKNKGNEKQKE